MKLLQPRVATLVASKANSHRWADPRRGTRHQRGYGSEWDRLRPTILQRDSHLCQTCLREGIVATGTIVDHVVPKAEGGSDDPTNLETICSMHHAGKTQRESARARGGCHGL